VNLVAYLRTSSKRRDDHEPSLQGQRKAVRGYATEHGHRIVAWHADEGVSGANGLQSRERLPEALAAIQSGRASGLVVYRLDRLSRDLVLQEQLLAEVWRMGGEVFSTAAGEAHYLVRDDPGDPSRKLIRQVLGAVNEYERSMIAMRLRIGKARKRTAGGFVGGGPPFGYRSEDKELVRDPAEQATLTRARALRDDGRSLREIAATLQQEGRRPRRSDRWHPETVRAILGRS
jgi:DNA invertase Pin-like site-specific DNA recombinase